MPRNPLQPSFVAYLRAKSATCTPKTVSSLATRLAHFGRFLPATDPDLTSLADLNRRRHIEPFITSLTTAVNSVTGEPITVADRIRRVHAVGNFLAQIAEWGWDDAPRRRLVFPSDMPRPDRPLPALPASRFRPQTRCGTVGVHLPTCRRRAAVATSVRPADRGTARPRTRLRPRNTRSRLWLKIPLGKLDTERMVPLDDQVLTVIDRITTTRSPGRPCAIPAPAHPRTSCSPITGNDCPRTLSAPN